MALPGAVLLAVGLLGSLPAGAQTGPAPSMVARPGAVASDPAPVRLAQAPRAQGVPAGPHVPQPARSDVPDVPRVVAGPGQVVIRSATTPYVLPTLKLLVESARKSAPPDILFEVRVDPMLTSLEQLCDPKNEDSPHFVLASRSMPVFMAKECATLKRGSLIGAALGRDAIILATRADSRPIELTAHDVYHALARDVPVGDEFRRNLTVRWSDIAPRLPQIDIRFQLPPASDHRRLIFDSLILEGGCRGEDAIKGIFEATIRSARCTTLRFDRVREIAREHAVRSLLEAQPGTIGVVSLRDVEESGGQLVALPLNGVMPSERTIQDGSYAFASTYWLYVRVGESLAGQDQRVAAEVKRLMWLAEQEDVVGPGGLLDRNGMVPLAADEREAQRSALTAFDQPYDLTWLLSWVYSAASTTWWAIGSAVSELRGAEPESKVDLAKLMDVAGYKLAEIESTVSLIPSADMTFKIVREMSEADREYLERTLYKDARDRPGLRSALQRQLIQSIIDISESGSYQVSKVEVAILPLPKAKLAITPKVQPLGQDAAAVIRAIERLQERLPEAWR